ncbi:MAG: hypothetical protein ABI647_18770 [Gemmatimonadota bacterium]
MPGQSLEGFSMEDMPEPSHAERQLVEALAKLGQAAKDKPLQTVCFGHEGGRNGLVQRLERYLSS